MYFQDKIKDIKIKFKGLIFDIDGTLTNTNQLIFDSFNHIADKFWNKTLPPEEIIKLFGPTEDDIIDLLFKEKAEEVKKEYFNYYESNHSVASLHSGMKELLEQVKQKSIPLGVYTGKGKTTTTITLKKFDLYDYFDLIITGSDVKEHKPSPEGISMFLDKFGLSSKTVLMIGDSTADIKAARAAKIKSALVLWDCYAKEECLKMNPDFIFNVPKELSDFLNKNI